MSCAFQLILIAEFQIPEFERLLQPYPPKYILYFQPVCLKGVDWCNAQGF
jgi:hypothetical protein